MSAARSLPPPTSLGYHVNYLARLLARALGERVKRFGVVPGQFAQLLALFEHDGLTQAELCQKVQIEQPTMANTLARIERDGLITRLPDPENRRHALVTLTTRAREMESDLVGAAMDVNRAATGGLDGEESTMFMTTLSKIIGNLETQQGGIDAAKDHQGR